MSNLKQNHTQQYIDGHYIGTTYREGGELIDADSNNEAQRALLKDLLVKLNISNTDFTKIIEAISNNKLVLNEETKQNIKDQAIKLISDLKKHPTVSTADVFYIFRALDMLETPTEKQYNFFQRAQELKAFQQLGLYLISASSLDEKEIVRMARAVILKYDLDPDGLTQDMVPRTTKFLSTVNKQSIERFLKCDNTFEEYGISKLLDLEVNQTIYHSINYYDKQFKLKVKNAISSYIPIILGDISLSGGDTVNAINTLCIELDKFITRLSTRFDVLQSGRSTVEKASYPKGTVSNIITICKNLAQKEVLSQAQITYIPIILREILLETVQDSIKPTKTHLH